MNIHEIAANYQVTQAQAAQAAAAAASAPKVYRALLTQSGTNAPVATVLENTLGGEAVWTRAGENDYRGNLSGAFPSSKLFSPYLGGLLKAADPISVTLQILSVNEIALACQGVEDNGIAVPIEILVYP